MQLGAHVSAAGGVDKAPTRGHEIGCQCIQVFTRNQRTWKAKPVSDQEANNFRHQRVEQGIGAVMSHTSYLINLAAPDPEKYSKSYEAMEAELERCHKLGIELMNFHPGAHLQTGVETGIARIAEALNGLCRDHPDKGDVLLVLEIVAGQGSTVGRTFEELAAILERLEEPQRFGICIDTAHAFAGGYDLITEEGWEQTWREFQRVLGMEQLVALHLNDSKAPFDSRKDRHALIGRGYIGPETFRRLVTDPRLQGLPMFLETPGGPEGWAEELKWLHAAAAGEDLDLPEITEAGIAL